MASWLGGGTGKGGGTGSRLVVNPPKPKKKERWLVTRKTWRYMADAGKLLIPEALRKGKDYKDYTEDDIQLLEEHYQNVCEQQQEFIIWEGPLEDPRIALAHNRKAPSLSSESQDPSDSSDFRFESHSAKFRIVLPSDEKPPQGYVQVGTHHFPVHNHGSRDPISSEQATNSTVYQWGQSGDLSEERIDSHRLLYDQATSGSYIRLPSGLLVQQLPPEIMQDADWSLSGSSVTSPLDSGILSPSDGEFNLSPHDGSLCSDDGYKIPDTRESGIGSGADSIVFSNKRNMSIQTDPVPQELYSLLEEEQGKEEGARKKIEEEEALAIAKESEALAKREQRRVSEIGETDETVMRYLKMVRRNSKSVDQKKADRFRSMNYDPTLRNIKAKHLPEQQSGEYTRQVAVQCGDPLVKLLKLCNTPVQPSREKSKRRKFSLTPSDSIRSPRYSITISDETIPREVERDFFTQVYGGESSGPESGNIPEEYYSYLEGWFCSQISGNVSDNKIATGGAQELQSTQVGPFLLSNRQSSTGVNVVTGEPLHQGPSNSRGNVSQQNRLGASGSGPPNAPFMPQGPTFIPVTALQSLRASLPAHLPQLTQGSLSPTGSSSVETMGTASALGISRSTASLATGVSASLPPFSSSTNSLATPSPSTNSLSFISSVMSKGRSGGNLGHGGSKMITKKLWRQRSKSQSRVTMTPQVMSPWTPSIPADPEDDYSWTHISGQMVYLQTSSLLHLIEIERIYLQKQAQAVLNSLELGTVVHIPKDTVDRTEMSKARKKANFLKKKVLSAGNLGGKVDKVKDMKSKSGEGVVFGIPINQCVDTSRKRSTTDIPADEVMSPTQKSSRSDSRTSMGSIFDLPIKDKSMERIGSPLHSIGSYESLDERVMRRSSMMGGSQNLVEGFSYSNCDRLIEPGDPSERINPQPCVPSVVNTCIKYLELNGLNTVGIFRVSANKKRVRQLREDFDSGVDVILKEEISVHDVATILKEFLRDLPEPLLPREVYHPLLAVQKIRNRKQQLEALQRVMQLLPQVNRDTLYVLLSFLHLVAENSEDRKGPQGEDMQGNKMDSNNLATLFAPNILHSMKPDGTTTPESSAKTAERTETINVVRILVDYNKELFELHPEDLHQLYLKMHDDIPEAMDYLLRRRALLSGDELMDDFDLNVLYDMPEPRLIGPKESLPSETSKERNILRSVSIPPILEGDTDYIVEEFTFEPKENRKNLKRARIKEEEVRGRTRRRGSEADGQEKGGSWRQLFREKSDLSEQGEQSAKWFAKKREKSQSTGSVRSPSNESVSSPPPKGTKKDPSIPIAGSTGCNKGVVTGSLKINVAGLQGDKQSFQGPELDIPYMEDCSAENKLKKAVNKRVVLRRLSQDNDGKILSCEIHLPSFKTSSTGQTDTLIYSPGSTCRDVSPNDRVFFGSGTSTPSNPLSPPPIITTPMVFSPPPSPGYRDEEGVTPTPSHPGVKITPSINVSVETKYLEPHLDVLGGRSRTSSGNPQDVSLVLKPVLTVSGEGKRVSPAESTKTLVNDDTPDIKISSEERLSTRSSPSQPLCLRRVKDTKMASSSLSLPPDSAGCGNRLSVVTPELRSKTENLENMLVEIERSSSDNGTNGIGGGNREVKRYIRRRYTDSRHPTTELPDIRGDLPSVRDPPVRKIKSKELLPLEPELSPSPSVGQLDDPSRSPSKDVSERPSYRRWQMSTGGKNSAEPESQV